MQGLRFDGPGAKHNFIGISIPVLSAAHAHHRTYSQWQRAVRVYCTRHSDVAPHIETVFGT